MSFSDDDSSSCSSNSSSSSFNAPNLNELEEGLSASTLSALLSFLSPGEQQEGEGREEQQPKLTKDTVCVAYTQNDVNVIADTYKRLAAQSSIAKEKNDKAIKERVLVDLENTPPGQAVECIMEKGVVRMSGVLSAELCDLCLESINDRLEGNVDVDSDESGFGNVLCRQNRWDMYLRVEGAVEQSMKHMFSSGDGQRGQLGRFFRELFQGRNTHFHELSSLVSDNGAQSQPIHPDTVFSETCPMYTAFVALQDVDEDMGPTIFIPNTHNQEAHESHKNPQLSAEFLSKGCVYKRSTLRKGDVAIMDSRTLHCGDANWKKRRCLMYMTLKNPNCEKDEYERVCPPGSKFDDLDLTLDDFTN